jgi:multicomponent Na+:H+ antiporter subunit F
MIAIAAALGASVALALAMVRLFAGPTLYDRMLATNAAVSKAVLVVAALAAAFGRAEWVDVALALVLALFVANVASLKFFRARTFQAPLARAREDA